MVVGEGFSEQEETFPTRREDAFYLVEKLSSDFSPRTSTRLPREKEMQFFFFA